MTFLKTEAKEIDDNMSLLLENLKQEQLADFIGPNGSAVLIKSLRKVFNQDDDGLVKTLVQLQVKNRALCSWIDLLSKKTIEPGDSIKAYIPTTQKILELVKADKDIYTAILGETQIVGKDLPTIASELMLLPEFEESLDKSEVQPLPQVQEVISFLVKEFLFPDKKHNTLNLNKSEQSACCPDCNELIKISPENTKLCFCYKFLGNNSLHIAKSDKGLKITFSNKWEKQNILMLAQALKTALQK